MRSWTVNRRLRHNVAHTEPHREQPTANCGASKPAQLGMDLRRPVVASGAAYLMDVR